MFLGTRRLAWASTTWKSSGGRWPTENNLKSTECRTWSPNHLIVSQKVLSWHVCRRRGLWHSRLLKEMSPVTAVVCWDFFHPVNSRNLGALTLEHVCGDTWSDLSETRHRDVSSWFLQNSWNEAKCTHNMSPPPASEKQNLKKKKYVVFPQSHPDKWEPARTVTSGTFHQENIVEANTWTLTFTRSFMNSGRRPQRGHTDMKQQNPGWECPWKPQNKFPHPAALARGTPARWRTEPTFVCCLCDWMASCCSVSQRRGPSSSTVWAARPGL